MGEGVCSLPFFLSTFHSPRPSAHPSHHPLAHCLTLPCRMPNELADRHYQKKNREAWRYTGIFSRWNRYKNAFPGLGIASVAFAGYCLYEHFFLKDEHHGHSEGHH